VKHSLLKTVLTFVSDGQYYFPKEKGKKGWYEKEGGRIMGKHGKAKVDIS
jgi:hypothetical protein